MLATAVRSFDVRVFQTPLKRPFATSRGRKTVSVNVGLTLTLRSGARGYGEASTSIALSHLTPRAMERVIRALSSRSVGRDAADLRPLIDDAWRRAGDCSPAAAAFEAALIDAVCADCGMSPTEWFGGVLREGQTDITISAVDAASSEESAREAASEGFRVLKVKVGTGLTQDLARVAAVRRAAPRAALILDGNQGLTVRSALTLVEKTLAGGARVELLEQPLPADDLRSLARLARRCPVPIVLDESVKTPEQALRAVDLGAAGGLNVKSAKSGYFRSLEISSIARAAGLPLMIGCMTETRRGLAASVQMALGTGWFKWLDLDSDHLLASNAPAPWSRSGRKITLDSPAGQDGVTSAGPCRRGSGRRSRRANGRAR